MSRIYIHGSQGFPICFGWRNHVTRLHKINMYQKLRNFLKIIMGRLYFPFLAGKAQRKIVATRENANTPENIYEWTQDFRVGPDIRGLNINFRASQMKS